MTVVYCSVQPRPISFLQEAKHAAIVQLEDLLEGL